VTQKRQYESPATASWTGETCTRCDGALDWETYSTHDGQRWLGICADCGCVRGVIVRDEAVESDAPLTDYLGAPHAQAASPPWVRLFRVSSEAPWNVHWKYVSGECARCARGVIFGTSAGAGLLFQIQLCLKCGQIRVQQVRAGDGHIYGALVSSRWCPTSGAVRYARRILLDRRRPPSEEHEGPSDG
jgi:hypothetical protein